MKSSNSCGVYSEKLLNISCVFLLYFECIKNIYIFQKKTIFMSLGLSLSSDINAKIKTELLPRIISVIFKDFVFGKIRA